MNDLKTLAMSIAAGRRCSTAGAYARIIRAKEGQRPVILTEDPGRRTVMVMGPSGLDRLRGKTGYQMLRELGYPPAYIRRKIAEGNRFWLLVMARPRTDFAVATWTNALAQIASAYPEAAAIIKRSARSLKRTSFAEFQRQAGFDLSKVDAAGAQDPRFMTLERLLAGDGSAQAVRRFLFHVERLNELYSGDGFTLTCDGRRGVREYITLNRPIADLGRQAMAQIVVGRR